MRAHDQLDLGTLDLKANERARIERLWTRFRSCADPNFARELASPHFHERYWEMCLAYVMLRRGMSLKTRDTVGGPDLCVNDGAGTIWVEATAPGPGTTEDGVPRPRPVELDPWHDAEDLLGPLQDTDEGDDIAIVPEDAIILRYRSALDEKLRKYVSYVEQSVIPSTEPYVVAMNGGGVHPIFGRGAVIPTIVKAVLGLGQLQLVFSQDLAGEAARRIEKRQEVQKKSGSRVRTDVFLSGDYGGMSGVLFSRCDVTTHLGRLGQDFVFVHNPGAVNPLPQGWLMLGQEYWLNENTLHVESWSSSRKRRTT